MGTLHRVENRTDSDVIIIETGMGDIFYQKPIYTVQEILAQPVKHLYKNKPIVPDIVPLLPAFKDNLWEAQSFEMCLISNVIMRS